jgi:hypothetical protein
MISELGKIDLPKPFYDDVVSAANEVVESAGEKLAAEQASWRELEKLVRKKYEEQSDIADLKQIAELSRPFLVEFGAKGVLEKREDVACFILHLLEGSLDEIPALCEGGDKSALIARGSAQSALFEALKADELSKFEEIEDGVRLHSELVDTPLEPILCRRPPIVCAAAYLGAFKSFRLFFLKDRLAMDDCGRRVAHFLCACRVSEEKIEEKILSELGWLEEEEAPLGECDARGRSPAEYAAGAGHIRVLEWLIERRILEKRGASRALAAAARFGQVDTVTHLLTVFKNCETEEALVAASESSEGVRAAEIVKLILNWSKIGAGRALRESVRRGSIECARVLLEAGAKLECCDGLVRAARTGRVDLLELLDGEYPENDKSRMEAFLTAAEGLFADCVEFLGKKIGLARDIFGRLYEVAARLAVVRDKATNNAVLAALEMFAAESSFRDRLINAALSRRWGFAAARFVECGWISIEEVPLISGVISNPDEEYVTEEYVSAFAGMEGFEEVAGKWLMDACDAKNMALANLLLDLGARVIANREWIMSMVMLLESNPQGCAELVDRLCEKGLGGVIEEARASVWHRM